MVDHTKHFSKFFFKTSPISISYKDLSVLAPSKPEKEILHKLSGSAFAGEVTALLGPSGAGKTTLLNALAWRTRLGLTGSINFNGKTREKSQKKVIGYVTQSDHFFSELTVEETLRYTAKLRRGGLTNEEINELVDEVIKLLSLESCRKTKVGDAFNRGISGGESKRLNIGNELLANPSVFFLDEPTSGLDSSSAVNVLSVCQSLAAQYGICVVLSIHQPSSLAYSMLDSVVLISNGYVIYQGNGKDVFGYLTMIGYKIPQGWNVADYVMELLYEKAATDYLFEKYTQLLRVDEKGRYYVSFREHASSLQLEAPSSIVKQQEGRDISSNEPRSESTDDTGEKVTVTVEGVEYCETSKVQEQTKDVITHYDSVKLPPLHVTYVTLLKRALKKEYSGTSQVLQTSQTIIISLIVGIVWLQQLTDYTVDNAQSRLGYLFFACTFWLFLPGFAALTSFPQERAIIAKERASKLYTVSMYVAARTSADALVFLVTPTIWLLVSYPMVGMPGTARDIFGTWITLLVSVNVAHSVGMAVSSIEADFRKGAVMLAVFLQAVMLTGGFFVPYEMVPSWLRWIRWISVTNYSISLLTHFNYVGRYFECPDNYANIEDCPIPGSVLRGTNATGFPIAVDFLFLVIYFCVAKIVSYLFLRFGKQLRMQ